jgi:ArsR family transcriptional regulator
VHAPITLHADPRNELLSRFFHALADITRVRILELLLRGERNVSELVDALGLQQGRVSSHLACLRWCGFVATRRDGKFVYYRVTDERVRSLIDLALCLLSDNAPDMAARLRLDAEAAD